MAVASGIAAPSLPLHRGGRPVLLATLGVPFEPVACELAVDSAVESGHPLLVVVLAQLAPLPLSVLLGYDQVDSPEDEEAFRAPAARAASLGVAVERLRVRSPRPVDALLQVIGEREPGLVVFGPDRTRVSRRSYRKAARALTERAPCLVWVA
jgi:hypothetical protein